MAHLYTSLRRRSTSGTLAARSIASLRVLLVLSLWHAPFPWMHEHDLEGSVVESMGHLARHVDEYHGDALRRGETHCGWHVHLVCPSAMDPSGKCQQSAPGDAPSDEGQVCGVLKFAVSRTNARAADDAGFLDAGKTLSSLPLAWMPIQRPTLTAGTGVRPPPHFLGTYGDSVALGTLLGVCLC